MKEELIYYERQRFNQWWVVPLMLIINGIFIYGCVTQIGMDKPWGNEPLSNMMLVVVTVLFVLLTVIPFFICVDTVINEEGVWVRIFPLRLRYKCIPWDQISDFLVRRKIMIGDKRGIGYKLVKKRVGGLGLQFVRRKTYNLSGNFLLELTLTNRKEITIGTQQPEELMEFLAKLDARRKQK